MIWRKYRESWKSHRVTDQNSSEKEYSKLLTCRWPRLTDRDSHNSRVAASPGLYLPLLPPKKTKSGGHQDRQHPLSPQNKPLSVTAGQSRGHTCCPLLQRGTRCVSTRPFPRGHCCVMLERWCGSCREAQGRDRNHPAPQEGGSLRAPTNGFLRGSAARAHLQSHREPGAQDAPPSFPPVQAEGALLFLCHLPGERPGSAEPDANEREGRIQRWERRVGLLALRSPSKPVSMDICHQAARARTKGSGAKGTVVFTSPPLNTCLQATAEVCSGCTYWEDTKKR